MYDFRKSQVDENVLSEIYNSLYYFQKETCEKTFNLVHKADFHVAGQYIHPTGAGKGYLAVYLTMKLIHDIEMSNGKPSVFGVACHRICLADNLMDRILKTFIHKFGLSNIKILVLNSGSYSKTEREYLDKIEDGLVYYEKKMEDVNEFIRLEQEKGNHVLCLMLYQSLKNIVTKNLRFDFLFCDEAHTTVDKQIYNYMKDFTNMANVVIHMTATRIVNGDGYDMTNEEIYGKIIDERQPRELVVNKIICPINVVLLKMKNKIGNVTYSRNIFSSPKATSEAIMLSSESLHKKVIRNQKNAGVSNKELKNEVLFCAISGNKHLKEFFDITSTVGKRFAQWRYNNDVDLYFISSELGGCIDFSETCNFDKIGISKSDFISEMDKIPQRNHRTIIIQIDMLNEGIDLPDINGVCILRALDENTQKLIQLIGRGVRRAKKDLEKGLVKDDTVEWDEYDKFTKPCSYVYIPTACFTKNEVDKMLKILNMIYPQYGDIDFRHIIIEDFDGDEIPLIDNPNLLKKIAKKAKVVKNINLNKMKVDYIEMFLMKLAEDRDIKQKEIDKFISKICLNDKDIGIKFLEFMEMHPKNVDFQYNWITEYYESKKEAV